MTHRKSVAVVTGGAAGIGLGVARELREQGFAVVIADIDGDAAEARAANECLHAVTCDVASDDAVQQLAESARSLGDVAFVLANAGVAVGGRFEQIPVSEWQRLFNVNVTGTVRTINAFLPDMLERGDGRIVVTGSSAGLFRSAGPDAPYAASKHALRAMAEGLAAYCQPAGIDVHYLAPRITDTAFPRSSVAWGRRGSRITSDRDIGEDYDTVEDVVGALFDGIADGRFLISLTPDTPERLIAMAQDFYQEGR